jgi:hypothetical protein
MMKRLFLIAMLGCAASVLGQTQDGTVSGQIKDQAGNPVPSVQVFLTPLNIQTGTRVYGAVQTDAQGVFRIDKVAPNQYRIMAAAVQATLFPGTRDASQAIVIVSSRFGPALMRSGGGPQGGTFFPGTLDSSKATTINVTPGEVLGNVNFTLATSTLNDASLMTIHGKIEVEGGGSLTLGLKQLRLFFSDGPGNRGTNVTFLDKVRQPVAASTRFEPPTQSSTLNSVDGVLFLPSFPDGAFHIYIREGVYRVIQSGQPAGIPSVQDGSVGYYIKGLSFGATDLMKDLMTVRGPIKDELVIRMAKCTAETRDEPLCR